MKGPFVSAPHCGGDVIVCLSSCLDFLAGMDYDLDCEPRKLFPLLCYFLPAYLSEQRKLE